MFASKHFQQINVLRTISKYIVVCSRATVSFYLKHCIHTPQSEHLEPRSGKFQACCLECMRNFGSFLSIQVMALSFWVAVTDRDVQLMGWCKICCIKSWRCFRRSGSYGFLVLLVVIFWSVCGWRIWAYNCLWLWFFYLYTYPGYQWISDNHVMVLRFAMDCVPIVFGSEPNQK